MLSSLFAKDTPQEAFDRIGRMVGDLGGKTLKIRGVLMLKTERARYSTFSLRMPDEVARQRQMDPYSYALQIFAYENEADELRKYVGWEVLIEGPIEFKVWTESSRIDVSLKEPRILKTYGSTFDIKENELAEVLAEFERNPRGKPRGEEVIAYLSNILRSRKLNILLIGPKGKGFEDILHEFERASGLENFVNLYTANRPLNPPSRAKEAEEQHFSRLVGELRDYAASGSYDLICFCRGGGDPNQLVGLNNKALCLAVINSNVPVCASIAHSTDALWLKRASDLFTNVPGVFVGELKRAVDAVYPNQVAFRASHADDLPDPQVGRQAACDEGLFGGSGLFLILLFAALAAWIAYLFGFFG